MSKCIGSFEARQTNLLTADVRYQVVVFPESLVAARTGGQSVGSAGYVLRHFGLIGAGLAAIFGSGDGAAAAGRAEVLERCTRQELLRRHERNFEVSLSAIRKAGLEAKSYSMHGDAFAKLFLDLGDREPVELLLQSREAMIACRDLLTSVLGTRLWVDRHVAAARGSPRAAAAVAAVAPPGWTCPTCGKPAVPSANRGSYVCENMHITPAAQRAP